MTDLRIAGGEMTRELYEFRDLIAEGCLDVLQPDAALVGGLTGLRRVALMAQEHNLVFTPHTWTNGMGVVANAHLAAGLCDAPFLEFPYDPPEWDLDRRDYMMAEPLKVDSSGMIVLSDRPGMGYEVNSNALAKTRSPVKALRRGEDDGSKMVAAECAASVRGGWAAPQLHGRRQ